MRNLRQCDSGKFPSVHFDLRGQSVRVCAVFTNNITGKLLFWYLPKINSILEYTNKQATAFNIDYQ